MSADAPLSDGSEAQTLVAGGANPLTFRLGTPAFGGVRRAGVAAVAALLTFFACGQLTPTRTAATMSILVDARQRDAQGATVSGADPALVEGQARTLTSRAVLRRVAESRKLAEDPDWAPSGVERAIGLLATLFRDGAGNAGMRGDALIDALKHRIAVTQSEQSYVLDVVVQEATPEKAVKLAAALADSYFANQAALAAETASRRSDGLDGLVADLKRKMDVAERRAQQAHDAAANESSVSAPPASSANAGAVEAGAALAVAQAKRAEVGARLQLARAALAGDAKSAAALESLSSPALDKLKPEAAKVAKDEADQRGVLGPRHPTYLATIAERDAVQAKIKAELARIETASQHDLDAADESVRAAERAAASAGYAGSAQPAPNVDLAALDRDAATLRDAYERAVEASARVGRDVVQSPIGTLVDPPTALGNASPGRSQALALAAGVGATVWLAMSFVGRRRPGPSEPERTAVEGENEGGTFGPPLAEPTEAEAEPAEVTAPPIHVDERAAEPASPEPPLHAPSAVLGADLRNRFVAAPSPSRDPRRRPLEARRWGTFAQSVFRRAAGGRSDLKDLRLSVASVDGVDASTVALRLADHASSRGRRTLVRGWGADLESYAFSLAESGAPSLEGATAAPHAGGTADLYVAARLEAGPVSRSSASAFEIVLSCVESLDEAAARVASGHDDGVVLVAPADARREDILARLDASRAAPACVVVVVPMQEAQRRAS